MKGKKGMLNVGRRSTKKFRIVGGKPVTKKDLYPWMTALIQRHYDPVDGQFCGGSLIDPFWVLTAAHCLCDEDPENLDVVLGFLKLDEKPKERINVEKIIIHPKYDADTSDFDVALIRLAKASKQKPIDMIPSGDPDKIATPGTMATIIGWGALAEGGPGSRKLMHVDVPIISNAEANKSYGGDVTKNMIAAGFPQGGKDACQGDSGGPFLVRDANLNLVLAGATSWGIGCAKPRYPGLYANLAVLGDWVRKTIQS
jgi:secreted trypsin-like serine protease